LILKKPEITYETDDIPDCNSVLIANHEDSWGPIAMICFYPQKLYPWVTSSLVARKECQEHIENDFILKELKLKPPLSKILACVIELICLPLMKFLEVIPVFRDSLKIRTTIRKSIDLLAENKLLLIFPENNELSNSEKKIDPFYSGFVNLALSYYRLKKISVKFFPVAVNKAKKFIRIGEPVFIDFSKSFREEKKRILEYLYGKIEMMYRS
jgi:1-acyl-sn-glycerol-3-phosphate acyltransferase